MQMHSTLALPAAVTHELRARGRGRESATLGLRCWAPQPKSIAAPASRVLREQVHDCTPAAPMLLLLLLLLLPPPITPPSSIDVPDD